MAWQWQREQSRERPEHGRPFQNPWEQQARGRERPEHGLQFQNPWERRPRDQRDHGRDDEDDYNTNYKAAEFVDPNNETVVKIPVVSWKELQYPSGQLGAIPKRPEVVDDKKQMEYLTRILGSKVYDVTSESPFHFAPYLSNGWGVNLWLKREDSHSGYSFRVRGGYNMMANLPKEELKNGVQKEEVEKGFSFKTRGAYNMMANLPKEELEKKIHKEEYLEKGFSFKTRGAYNMMANLPKEELEKGAICASTGGDHAQGLALAANKLGIETVIVMPTTTPPIKVEIVENLGGKVVLYGDTFDDAQARAKQLSQQQNLRLIPPFDHEDVILGQATIGMEIGHQMRGPLHAIFVPVGGGDLLAGIASFYKLVFPEVKIIGVEAHDANCMALALHKNEIVKLVDIGSFADGVGVQQVGNEAFRITRELVDGIVLVDKDAISTAIKEMYEDNGSMLEPAGVVSIAGAKAYCKYNNIKGVNIVAVTNGSNINFNQLPSIVHIADAANQTEATFATKLPEKPGTLRQFSHLLEPWNITEFKYRYNSENEAVVLFSVGANVGSELEDAKRKIESSPFETYCLTKNEIVLDHLRYMVGGRSKVPNEVLYRFTLPERPGALAQFLDAFSPRWNISLVHYRRQGASSGDVLVGVQTEEAEMDEFHESAKKLGFNYSAVADDPASKLLLTQL